MIIQAWEWRNPNSEKWIIWGYIWATKDISKFMVLSLAILTTLNVDLGCKKKWKKICLLVIQQSKECRTITLHLKAGMKLTVQGESLSRVRAKGSSTEMELVKDKVSRIVWGFRLWNYPLIHFVDVSCNHGAWMCSFNALDLLLCVWNGLNSQFFSLFATFKFSIYLEMSSMKILTISTKVR